MKLSVTGDIHGDVFLLFGMTESMSDEEMLFVAGDFGMFWYDTKICQEKMLIINDILESKNSYIVFVDGNHDNHKFLNKSFVITSTSLVIIAQKKAETLPTMFLLF